MRHLPIAVASFAAAIVVSLAPPARAQVGPVAIWPVPARAESGIAAGADGTIDVSETWNGRVQVFEQPFTPARPATWGALKARWR
jgi:hypothetical protein